MNQPFNTAALSIQPSELAIINLAAGKGTRMQSVLPKCMHLLANKPMISYSLDTASQLNAQKIYCIISNNQPSLQQTLEQQNIPFIFQQEQLGTAHAVLQTESALNNHNGYILVTYGDTPLVKAETLAALIEKTKNNNAYVGVLGFQTQSPGRYGRLIFNHDDALVAIVEAKDATPVELGINVVNSGVMALKSPECWDLLKQIQPQNESQEYYLTDMVMLATNNGYPAVAVLGDEQEFIGINTPLELATAEQMIQQQLRQKLLLSGVRMLDPNTVFLSYDTQIAPDVTIEPNVFFGTGVTVDTGCVIHAFSHIEQTHIHCGAKIGPYARLRPGTVIGESAKIGNFVEIKKSTIGKTSKVNHLTYIGNTTIGQSSNIGAGTVTCNYDGFNKFNTYIGDHVFIGSNTIIVAPARIESNSTTGAGSVITDDVTEGSLALTRPARKDIAGWTVAFKEKQKKNRG